jgi:hypothetical protein
MISLRGGQGTVEVILKDREGTRASRECSNLDEIVHLLSGWEHQYGCDTYILYINALQSASEEVYTLIESQVAESIFYHWLKPLDAEIVKRILVLGASAYRPPEIRELKDKIKNETRLAEFMLANTGQVSEEHINHIVQLKLNLDATYASWAENELN